MYTKFVWNYSKVVSTETKFFLLFSEDYQSYNDYFFVMMKNKKSVYFLSREKSDKNPSSCKIKICIQVYILKREKNRKWKCLLYVCTKVWSKKRPNVYYRYFLGVHLHYRIFSFFLSLLSLFSEKTLTHYFYFAPFCLHFLSQRMK